MRWIPVTSIYLPTGKMEQDKPVGILQLYLIILHSSIFISSSPNIKSIIF